jgi:Kazal-type serine protease inhibitor domain
MPRMLTLAMVLAALSVAPAWANSPTKGVPAECAASPPIGCFCPGDKAPYAPVCVCGESFASRCAVDCMHFKGPVHYVQGRCKDPKAPYHCFCSGAINKPVCGADNKTYKNDCLAVCEGNTKWTKGKCKPSACEVACRRHRHHRRRRVCGVDGKTYKNACLARCKVGNKFRPGACDEPCSCPKNIQPVCGDDGQTYDNKCYARCAFVTKTKPGRCPRRN